MSEVIVLSGGGTAGHINPALALAEELQDQGFTIMFAGTPHGVESRLVPDAGIPFKGFEASGFRRSHPLSILTGVHKISRSTKSAKRWFEEISPRVVVGFGGYVSIPVTRAAEQLGIPVVIHEQNSVMGMANKYLAKRAQAVCLTYGHAAKDAPGDANVFITGNPVRRSVVDAQREAGRAYLGIPDDATVLLVFGGSLGAQHINDAIVRMKDDLLGIGNLHVVHITGPKDLDRVTAALKLTDAQSARYHLFGYQDNMAEVLAAADAIVSRAGATSLAEISARHIPAVLVPFPYAAENHQELNAREYVDSGAAKMILDQDLDADAFAASIIEIVEDLDMRARMSEASRGFGTSDAARALAKIVTDQIG